MEIISIFAIDNIYNMNIQQMEYVIALDRFKNFSKAAEACFITQATLSTMIKRLETELDTVLFDRRSNPVITTDAGKAIVKEAERLVFHGKRITELAAEYKHQVKGELRIGIIPTIASSLLPILLPEIALRYPELKLKILEITTQNIVNKLKYNELDVGLLSTPLPQHELQEEILFYEKLMVYGSQIKKNVQYKSPEELDKQTIWLLQEGNCLANQISNICGLSEREQFPNIHFYPSSFDTLLNLVDKMQGITLIPELLCMSLSQERKDRLADFISPYPVREISLLYHRPYAKITLINNLYRLIKELFLPLLSTSKIPKHELLIAQI